MEWCDRGSVQDFMEKNEFFMKAEASSSLTSRVTSRSIDLQAVVLTLAEICDAMSYLHHHRITHRDLKPKNILLKSSNKDRRGYTAKVSDFGLSQVLPDQTKTQVSTKYGGTVTHMSPELIEDGKVYQQGQVRSGTRDPKSRPAFAEVSAYLQQVLKSKSWDDAESMKSKPTRPLVDATGQVEGLEAAPTPAP
eukprot:gene12034-15136_t